MRKTVAIITISIVGLFFVFTPLGRVIYADELSDIKAKLAELNSSLQSSEKATATNERDLASLTSRLNAIKNQVDKIESDIVKKEGEIKDGEKRLAQQKTLLDDRVASYYKNKGRSTDALLQVILSDNLSMLFKQLAYQQSLLEGDRKSIIKIVLLVKEVEEKKLALEDERTRLIPIKEEVAKQSSFLEGEVLSAKKFQQSLKTEIASLTAKQQQIINARSGSFTANIGDSELADDYNASIKGFRESAPSGYFAVFSFGAYTHRKGMSQYGAYGRAVNQGQDYKQILREYYGKDPVSKNTDGTIKVAGHGDIDFETTYLYGIAEMPSSWHIEALKAQAVAARSYAIRYKDKGTEICISQSCQVFRDDKSSNPPENWKKAVDDTRGQVLEDVVTYYSSTTGGYITTKGWDTTDGSGGSNFIDKSYEKIAGSPWVYKAWYTESYSNSSDKCGRENPWLSSQEMADIINATMVMTRSGSGADTGRVTPTSSCWGGNPYSFDDLRNVSDSYGGGVSNVNGVSVTQGNGVTNEVIFQTDKGEKRMSGTEFKKGFNVRAPGRLSIPQYQFAFFNIEKK